LAYYEDRLPRDATTLVKFRQLLGEEGVEELLAQTICGRRGVKVDFSGATRTIHDFLNET